MVVLEEISRGPCGIVRQKLMRIASSVTFQTTCWSVLQQSLGELSLSHIALIGMSADGFF